MSRHRRPFLALALALALGSCAKERPPRSYVQPNIIAKADLEGEWYYVPTVIDINLGSGVTFVGEAGWDVAIIKWDIQENVLYARLAYDRIENTDSRTADPNFKGEVMGAWRIEKQFDIIRDYNATTGEETNVIRESTERPWYEREFIRVDWSENLVSNWSFIWRRAVTTDPINYFVNDPNHPHAPKIERKEDGEAYYISIVNKVLVTPDMRDLEGWDFMGLKQLPDCFFYGSLSSCTSTEVTVRHAFWKKDPDNEYEPLLYTQKDMDDYGFFLSERKYYSQDYGVTVGGLKWYANRFNLWAESFVKATTDEEAAMYALAELRPGEPQCPEPEDGGPRHECPGDGAPCRCRANGHKIFITAELAYRYADVPMATTAEEAQRFAPAVCGQNVSFDCSSGVCTCEGGKEIAILSYRNDPLPQELVQVGDEVICPCDPDAEFEFPWQCDPDEPKPCFFKYDGRPVYRPTVQGKYRLPLRYFERPLRQIPYYVNDRFPEEGLETARKAIETWGRTFNEVVWRASGCEMAGKKLGQDQCTARPELDPGSGFLMFVFCHNPVQEDDPEVCGPAGLNPQPGDIRVNHLVYWPTPQQASPLGYGPPLADPLTGEVVSAVANIYGAPMETYAVWARDIVRMLTDKNFPWSKYLTGYMQQAVVRHMQHLQGLRRTKSKDGKVALGAAPYVWERKRWTREEIARIYDQMDFSWTKAIQSRVRPDVSSPEALRNWMAAQAKAVAEAGVLGNGTRPDLARLNQIRDTFIEDMMMTNDMLLNRIPTLVAAGMTPAEAAAVTGADLAYGSELRRKVSPLTWLNVNYLRAITRVKFAHFANTHMYLEFAPISFEEPSTIGLAHELVKTLCSCSGDDCNKCADDSTCSPDDQMDMYSAYWASDPECGEKIRKHLLWAIFDPVAVHEMGHNMGLRHNFKGSFDAMNYHDEYWEIRVDGVLRRGDTEIKERWEQPRSRYEDENQITKYQWASIMDYGAKFNSDFSGLGRWDVAAVNYAYTGFVQVFKEIPNDDVNKKITLGVIQTFRSFSWPTPITFGIDGPEAILSPKLYYDTENPSVTPDGVVNLKEENRDWRPRAWVVTKDIGRQEVLMTSADLEDDAQAKILVPYKFCSDEYRNISLGCNYFDEGSDLFEITQNQIQAYENYYIFNNFGRDRYTWGWDEDAYTRRILVRYFDILQNHMQYYVLYRSIMENDWWENDPGVIDRFFKTDWAFYTLSVAMGFDTFVRALNTAAPGFYGCDPESWNRTDPDGTPYVKMDIEPRWCPSEAYCQSVCQLQVPIIEGKYWDDTWDFDLGYQWYLRRIRYGHFYDRPLALQMMAEATNNFLGRDTQEDFRLYTINYTRVYPDQLLQLVTAIQANDKTVAAPRLCQDQAGNYYVEDVRFSDLTLQPCEALQQTMRDQGALSHDPDLANIQLTFTGKYLDPGHTFTIQLYTAVFGMAMFPMTYSQEFIDKWRVFVKGQVEGHDFSQCQDLATDGCETVEFTDPLSQKTFVAVRYPERVVAGRALDVSIGATMIDRANLLKQRYEQALAACGGQACSPDQGPLYTEYFRSKKDLQDFVENLEMIRSLTYLFDHPGYSGSAGY